MEKFLQSLEKKLKMIPGIGYLDDAAIIATCWKLVESDVDEYQKWRQANYKIID